MSSDPQANFASLRVELDAKCVYLITYDGSIPCGNCPDLRRIEVDLSGFEPVLSLPHLPAKTAILGSIPSLEGFFMKHTRHQVRRKLGIGSTDDIMPARYKRMYRDPRQLAPQLFGAYLPGFTIQLIPEICWQVIQFLE